MLYREVAAKRFRAVKVGGTDGDRHRIGVDRLHQEALVVTAGPDFSKVTLIAVVGRSVVENEVVDAGAIDGVKLGTASGAFGHWRTPKSGRNKNAPAGRCEGDRR